MSYRQRAETVTDGGFRPELRCRLCGSDTSFETLAMLGARCGRCYLAYCSNVPAAPKVPDSAIPQSSKKGLEWAYRLRWRHQQGEDLSRLQIASYRGALGRAEGEMP